MLHIQILMLVLGKVRAVREEVDVAEWNDPQAEAKLRERMAGGQPLIEMSSLDTTVDKKNWECGYMAKEVPNRKAIKHPQNKADYLVANYIVESHCPFHNDGCFGCAKHV